MAESCKGCVFYRRLDSAGYGIKVCHYLLVLDTGEPWGCPVSGCTRRVDRNREKKHEEARNDR